MSFAHGAQDGLKFIGIMIIYSTRVSGNEFVGNESIILLICALAMGLGVLIGGKKIVTTVGEKMIKLENEDALCTDISTVLTLISASLLGMPVSTTHVKTMSIATLPGKKKGLNKEKFKEIALSWGPTFPVCGILAFILTKIIIIW